MNPERKKHFPPMGAVVHWHSWSARKDTIMKHAMTLALLVSCSGCETVRQDIAVDPEAAGAGGTGGGTVVERTGGIAGSAGAPGRISAGGGAAGESGGAPYATGGAPYATGATPATGGGTPVDFNGSFLEEGTFSRLEAQVSDRIGIILGQGGTCGGDNFFTVEARSRRLSWDFCSASIAGDEDLTEAEFQGVINTASLVTPSTRESCGGERGPVSLDVVDEDGLAIYQDDFYAGCFPGSPGRTFVTGTSDLVYYLNQLISVSPLSPETPPHSIAIQRPDPISDPDSSAAIMACQDAAAGTIIDVMLDRRELQSRRCLGSETDGYRLDIANRPLTVPEYEALVDAYAALQVGASGPCSSLSLIPGPEPHRITVNSYTVVDESASCIENASAGLFAIGVEPLYELLAAFEP